MSHKTLGVGKTNRDSNRESRGGEIREIRGMGINLKRNLI